MVRKSRHNHHPFARSLKMEYFGNPKDPIFKKLTFKQRLAWRLRMLANRFDGGFTMTLKGEIPEPLDGNDFLVALDHGLVAIQQYMADEAQERSIVLADENQPEG